jgi:hypothetical protein
MRIRLTQKFADMLNGIDLRCRRVGDTWELPDEDAHVLIAEAWAVACAATDVHSTFRSAAPNRSIAHAKKRRR